MLAKTKSYALNGVEGYEVAIEVDLNAGLPAYDTVPQSHIARNIHGLAYPVTGYLPYHRILTVNGYVQKCTVHRIPRTVARLFYIK